MRIKTTLNALFLASLLGLSSAASAEIWVTTSANTSPDQGDPLTFSGSEGTVVTIDGFRTDMVGSGLPYADTPTAIAFDFGVGVERTNNASDYHTIGNNAASLDWTDGILLSFGAKSANISSIVLASNAGWGDGSSDKDFELWAFTGEAGAPGLPTTAYANWAPGANGWTRVADVNGGTDNVGGTDVDTFSTPNSVSSSQWIVLAANADHKRDAFKFKKFVATIKKPCVPGTPGCGGGQVPVPGTLALLGIGALLSRRFLFAGRH